MIQRVGWLIVWEVVQGLLDGEQGEGQEEVGD